MDQISKIKKIHKLQDNITKSVPVRIIQPYSFTYSFRVKANEATGTLVDYLHARFPFRGTDEWIKRIITSNIKVNELDSAPDYQIKPGDCITHFNPSVKEPAVPDLVKIVQETDDYIAVYKPAPMPVHPGGRYYKNTLTSVLADMGYRNLRLVHRLDSVTSGLIILAKNANWARLMQQAFTAKQIQKKYIALVRGSINKKSFTCNEPITRDTGFRFKCSAEGKPSSSGFRVLKYFPETDITKVECIPYTGRTHQLRLHLAHCGFPILGDLVYEKTADISSSNRLQSSEIALFSSSLSSKSPVLFCSLQPTQHWVSSFQ
ncbi:MAG: RluA family pseudouridine synthase [Balneolales bacterium]|nr:RluA family pseudouridine synthase [Balneolales bacterium]